MLLWFGMDPFAQLAAVKGLGTYALIRYGVKTWTYNTRFQWFSRDFFCNLLLTQ